MKKFLIIISVIVVAYFVLASILTATNTCPKYINAMPGIGPEPGWHYPDKENPKWYIFCPFAEKVY